MPLTKHLSLYQKILIVLFVLSTSHITALKASDIEGLEIKSLIEFLRKDSRGPYKDIRWFCEDGTILEPKSSCPGKGNQHARLKDQVSALAQNHNIYLTQILTGSDIEEFWDDTNAQSRMIQYQIEQFLFDTDGGWINEKGQYYRGAKQIEDEMDWGRNFFLDILQDSETLEDKYLLLRRAGRDIPHGIDNNDTRSMRALSLGVSDMMSQFQNIRIKIHGLPQPSDIQLVLGFKENNKLNPQVAQKIDSLLSVMESLYSKTDTLQIREYLKTVPKSNVLNQEIQSYLSIFAENPSAQYIVEETAELLDMIRDEILNVPKATTRLDLLDLSNLLEDIILIESNKWQPNNLDQSLDKLCYLNLAICGGGYIRPWERQRVFDNIPDDSISIGWLEYVLDSYRRSIQWGTGMVYAFYKDDVATFSQFEPKATGFNDDIIRSSPLLAMGHTLDMVHTYYAKEVNLENNIFDLQKQSQNIGINPGYAKGILRVIDNFDENPTLDPAKIYAFNMPPKELKPLAGIATVTEGNVVSHVQLLARNLGIPNAALSLQTLNALKKYEGEEVFYAVSNMGTVIMKPSSQMTVEESALFDPATTKKEKITISLDKLILDQTNIINIRDIDATASGKLCGPKAANLAQLKNIFPDMVVEGFVIPFGIYKQHMDQVIPGRAESYWQYIQRVLYFLKDLDSNSMSQEELDGIQIKLLDSLRSTIMNIDFLPQFEDQLTQSFKSILGDDMGKVPVFLRSDTNMEDLKEFTGAGLNLTLFNVLAKDKIIRGIKQVWASPFTERSYKWRQKYLDNPENIYPSILVIPSVDVEKSGVLITKGIANDNPNDITIAFSQGVGGAVDGQSAETYLAHHQGGYTLLSPSRENIYKSTPVTGGTVTNHKVPGKIVNYAEDLMLLKEVASDIKNAMPDFGMEGPYDVELGIKEGQIWLFQIRPFVENKRAVASSYLKSISPLIDYKRRININVAL